MNTITDRDLLRRRADLEVVVANDHVVLVDHGGSRHVLNPTAHALWLLCDGATTPVEMASAVCDVFDVDGETATRDVTVALEALVRDGLVEVVP